MPPNRIFAVLLSLIMLFITGCGIPLSKKEINNHLFENPAMLGHRVKLLKPHMSEGAAFGVLGIKVDTPNLEVMTTESVKSIIYTNAEVRGTAKDLDDFKEKLLLFKGYRLPYVLIDKAGSLGFIKWTIEKTGHEQNLIMIFCEGKLVKVALEGRPTVREKDTDYLWSIIWDVIKSGAETGASKAAAAAVPPKF